MRKSHTMLAMGAVLLPVALAQPSFAADAKHDTAVQHEEGRIDADNTKRNARDADGNTLTPMDQGSSEADMSIAQQIRKAVVDSDKLSTNAKNVKITQDGVVTFRGPVKTREEKATIASVAQRPAA